MQEFDAFSDDYWGTPHEMGGTEVNLEFIMKTYNLLAMFERLMRGWKVN